MIQTIHSKTEKQLVPELRFKEFEGEWVEKKLGDVLKITSAARVHKEEWTEKGVPFFRTSDVVAYFKGAKNTKAYIPLELYESLSNKIGRVKKDDLLITGGGSIGIPYLIKNSDPLYFKDADLLWLKNTKETSGYFLYSFLITQLFRKYLKSISHIGTIAHYTVVQAKNTPCKFPSLPEQQKIASFLSVVDEKIQQLTKKKTLLEAYKKGVMQQLFKSPLERGERGVSLRFKDENGNPYPDWEDAVMQDVFERVKEKNKENNLNVMSISAQQGLVNQLEYFNRYVSAADVTGYYLLKKGDFAYNKSYSKGYPMGAIKRLDRYDKGVVSTLYICFRIKENDDSTFYKEFLNHGGINSELHKIAQEGARNHGLLNMSVIEFFRDIKIPRPSAEEQIVIGKFLEDLSVKIESAKKELTQTQTFKKGLLQQLFV